jgi:hypothetical protein
LRFRASIQAYGSGRHRTTLNGSGHPTFTYNQRPTGQRPVAYVEHGPNSRTLIATVMLLISHSASFESLIPCSVLLCLPQPLPRDLLRKFGLGFGHEWYEVK